MSLDSITAAVQAALGEVGSSVSFSERAISLKKGETLDGKNLAALIGDALGRPELAPSWLPAAVKLTEFAVSLDADDQVELRLGAEVAIDWSPFDGLTVMGGAIEIVESGGRYGGAVSGKARLDKLALDLSVRLELPSEVFVIELAAAPEADEQGGAQLLDRLGLIHASATEAAPPSKPAGTAAAPVALTPRLIDLSLAGSIALGEYVLHVEAADLIHLPLLTLSRVMADVRVGAASSVSVFIEALVPYGPDRIVVDLLGEIGADGWRLQGAVRIPAEATVGALWSSLWAELAQEPPANAPSLPSLIDEMALTALDLVVDTTQHLVAFHCGVTWPHDGATLDLRIEHRPEGLDASGVLRVDDCNFVIAFDHGAAGGAVLVGAFSANSGVGLPFGALVRAVGGGDLEGADSLALELKDAALAYASAPAPGQPSAWLMATDLGLGLDLAALHGLPLVGSLLPAGQSLKLGFAAGARSDWRAQDLARVQGMLPATVTLPQDKGIHISATLDIGGAVEHLPFETTHSDAQPAPVAKAPPSTAVVQSAPPPPAPNAAAASPMSWHPVDRSFGPVHIGRVGLQWDGPQQQVGIALDASLGIAGLTLSLQGFGARYRLSDHHLELTLSGLGLDLKSGPLELAGAFLNVDGDFAGKVLIRTEQFSLAALGAFTMLDGAPSMFIYGLLDYPIGGPSFCYVEGLAAGFGYNRHLTPPEVTAVRTFPLVVDALKAAKPDAKTPAAVVDPGAQLAALHQFIQPSLGQNFLAVGLKFNSFKLIDSFLLLIVSFGERPEVDLIGSCTYQSPPGDLGSTPALVSVGLDFVGRFPLDGELLQIDGALTPGSYVYSPHCAISGGFAFYSWVKGPHAGNFVLSIGGYHPSIHPEQMTPRWPVVKRLALDYQLSPEVSIQGTCYLALAPSMVMAGCSVNAAVHIGGLEAGFSMELDFLICWEPYHYAFDAHIEIYARWKCFDTSASATLSVHGPEFAGYAHVHWFVFSFDVHFGSADNAGPTPIAWDAFQAKFLPAPADVCALRVVSGLVATVPATAPLVGDCWVVNPVEFKLAVCCAVPATAARLGTAPLPVAATTLGIAPMNRQLGVSSLLQVVVERKGGETWARAIDVSADFSAETLDGNFPAALWGPEFQPSLDAVNQGKTVVPGISGLSIRHAGPVGTGRAGGPVALAQLGLEDTDSQTVTQHPREFRLAAQAMPGGMPSRSRVLESLGFSARDLSISAGFVDACDAAKVRVVELR